ncbi:helix-turn-helix domain-containing protein [Falsirhodobacter sp. alg1]|uniref:helix-turn-helix domain-containing protein n=1 Tax=Falsirhodobacter sp. alg1 TaxID=1472418 RepID=UPI0005EE594C|nr:helix-turn-helix transcriptional regulator [Falsirhodobacter sp. alg1]
MTSQQEAISHVGERLRAFRMGQGLTPDDVASRTGISRAAIYRYEAGQPIRVDVLGKIADLLGVSLTSLLGVGSEFISSSLTFFERMLQLEASSDQISVLFGPVSYLLTTDSYDSCLRKALFESVPDTAPNRHSLKTHIDQIMEVLAARKASYRRRRPGLISLVSVAELDQFLGAGFVGKQGITGPELRQRKAAARTEVESILRLLVDQPMGVQIGLVEDSLPGTSFQIFRNSGAAQVAVSPFRLGLYANIRIGVATITSAQESVQLHQDVTAQLWRNSRKGEDAIQRLRQILRHE